MTPVAVRIWAAALALIAFALRVAHAFWWDAHREDLVDQRLIYFYGAMLVIIILPFALFALIARTLTRPNALEVRNGAFVAPNSPVYGGFQAILLMVLASGLVPTMSQAREDLGLVIGGVGFVALFLAGAIAFLVVQQPWLRLDRDGITIQRLRRTVLAWDDLTPGGPQRPAKKNPRALLVAMNRPHQGFAEIPVGWLHVDPGFLADAIRHYVEHAADREQIGTAAELVRLCSASASDPVPAR